MAPVKTKMNNIDEYIADLASPGSLCSVRIFDFGFVEEKFTGFKNEKRIQFYHSFANFFLWYRKHPGITDKY